MKKKKFATNHANEHERNYLRSSHGVHGIEPQVGTGEMGNEDYFCIKVR